MRASKILDETRPTIRVEPQTVVTVEMEIDRKTWGSALHLMEPLEGLNHYTDLAITLGKGCGWHYHQHKTNYFFVLAGSIVVEWLQDDGSVYSLTLEQGDTFHFAPNYWHRFSVKEPGYVVELYTTESGVPDRADIIRHSGDTLPVPLKGC